MRRVKKIITALLATACLLAAAGPAAAGELRLTLAYAGGAGSASHDLFLKPWAQRLPILSTGRLRVELLAPDPQDQTSGNLFERLRTGEADLVWAPIADLPAAFPELSMFELWIAVEVRGAQHRVRRHSRPL